LVLGLVRELGDWRCLFGDGREAGIKIGQLALYRNNLFKYYFIYTYESFDT
jgi:hypothetical protein